MGRLATQVLDTMNGCRAAGMRVSLHLSRLASTRAYPTCRGS